MGGICLYVFHVWVGAVGVAKSDGEVFCHKFVFENMHAHNISRDKHVASHGGLPATRFVCCKYVCVYVCVLCVCVDVCGGGVGVCVCVCNMQHMSIEKILSPTNESHPTMTFLIGLTHN